MLINRVSVLLYSLQLCSMALAIIPDVLDKKHQAESTSEIEPGHLSLPNLLHLTSINDLSSTWDVIGIPSFDTGRLIFGQGSGSIWSIAGLENTPEEWTIELVFRSTGSSQDDLQYAETNGLSFWLIDPSNSDAIDINNMGNFGGPSMFDGFQFLMNTKGSKGVRVFSNDGTSRITNEIERSIGNCVFNYLDSQIPFSLRVSYSTKFNWFKIQIDNSVCFKTDKIKIPTNMGDFKFGISSNIDDSSKEEFEVLGLKVWSHLTEDAIDDHAIMSDGHIKVEYTTVVQDSQPTSNTYFSPGHVRESIMEKTQRHKKELERQKDGYHQVAAADSDINFSIISESIDKLQQQILIIEKTNDYNSKGLLSQINEVKAIETQQKQILSDLQQSLIDFKSTITQQYSQMLAAVSKINEKVIGEVREQQYSMDELSKKVDLLMSNHKEISYQYQKSSQTDKETDLSGIINAIIKWILIPVVVGIIILTIIVYRLRHDIKHSKLL